MTGGLLSTVQPLMESCGARHCAGKGALMTAVPHIVDALKNGWVEEVEHVSSNSRLRANSGRGRWGRRAKWQA